MQRSIVPFQTLPPVALYRLAARVLCLMALALTGVQAHAQQVHGDAEHQHDGQVGY